MERSFRNDDLVLRVSKNIDPSVFDLAKYEVFIDAMCSTREYQKEAIATTLRYFLGGRYTSLSQLAEENYDSLATLKDRYGTFKEMERHLQLPDKLSASVDLATATGKSYVMHAIARIMLAHGVVDRVLVLCPSRTIEKGLVEKFRRLSTDARLRDALPPDAAFRVPHISTGTESIVPGTICIENMHQTLEHVKSSIRDSLSGRGATTLVLNDEVHHVYSPTGRDLKRWKEFLADPVFGFRFIAGFSGTCYIDDDYFADVIYRYSLSMAIDQGFAKAIDYVSEDVSESKSEKFQKIYDNHVQNKTYYRKVKPVTILVTRDIAACKRLQEDLIAFLQDWEGISVEEATAKVLIVTSARDHQSNLLELERVDDPHSPVEWVTSVSMLTEGWDVQNVFQIVPHEERAFNSKLLIAQVLGRGLRVPSEYRGERPVVTVFNHDAWSSRIKYLVDEVIEYERRLYSRSVIKTPDYNFTLHHIDYLKDKEVSKTFEHEGEYDFSNGVKLVSQIAALERETVYTRAATGQRREKRTLIKYEMFSVEEVALHIHNKMKGIDTEAGTSLAETYNLEWLRDLIAKSLREANETVDRLSAENRQRIQKAVGMVYRTASQVVRYRMDPDAIRKVSTSSRNRDSIGVAALRRDATIFYDDNSLRMSDEETQIALQDIIDDESLPRSALLRIDNTFHFKTPLSLVIANHKPERDFIRQLVKPENAAAIDNWIKSTDQDFYSIEFSWRKGTNPKRGFFNPDFFLRIGSHTFVIEVKGDEEIGEASDENKAKYRDAIKHFDLLNSLQSDATYRFHFLSPADYDKFFRFLRDGNYNYVSHLDAALESNGARDD